ncbi:unnamed protein product [Coffea canephora]|uniref:Uncharacterized protein n=1 Tax=Coffea canephora TaxID=49390 RepID=A0A068V375_COFCA|nr:unnamed protein product [Coffea canephora]
MIFLLLVLVALIFAFLWPRHFQVRSVIAEVRERFQSHSMRPYRARFLRIYELCLNDNETSFLGMEQVQQFSSSSSVSLQESLMINTLQFNLSVPTPYVFMRRFLKAPSSFYLLGKKIF